MSKQKTAVIFGVSSQDGSYFALPYKEHGEDRPFYVDFIVRMKDEKIGLFDTKGGLTAETAKARAEGLAIYVAEQNKKGKKLFGGIVIKDRGSWRYHSGKNYSYNPNDLSSWEYLNLS